MLIKFLETETVDQLKARLFALSYRGSKTLKKCEIISLLDKLLAIEELKKYWQRLDDNDKAVIAEVAHGPDNVFVREQFFAKYKYYPKFNRDRSVKDYYRNNMTLLGAFFIKNTMLPNLREQFRSFVPQPKKTVISGVTELAEEEGLRVRNMEISAMGEIKAILQLIANKQLTVGDKTKYPSASTIKTVTGILFDGDFYNNEDELLVRKYDPKIGSIRAFAWMMLIQAAKLTRLSGGALKLNSAGEKALTEPTEQILKNLWQKWLSSEILDEFRRIDIIKGQTGKRKSNFTDPIGRREVIETALREIPLNTWVNFDDFSNFMLANHLTFAITIGDPWNLYICDQQYGSLGYAGCHEWNILQKRYLACVLLEYAATLGIIDVAYIFPGAAKSDYNGMWGADDLSFFSRYDGLKYFKVNALGAYCLELVDKYTPCIHAHPQLKITVDDNGKITLEADAIESYVFILLDSFAKRDGNNSWLLSQESILLALQNGHSLADLQSFFLQHKANVSKGIDMLFEDLQQKIGLIKKQGIITLYECATSELADYFVKHYNTGKYCSLVESRLLAVPEDKSSKFQNELFKLGYLVPHKNK